MPEPLQGGCDFALAFPMCHASSFVNGQQFKDGAAFFGLLYSLPLAAVFRPARGPAGCQAHHTEGRDPARWWEWSGLNRLPPAWWCHERPRSRPVLRRKRTSAVLHSHMPVFPGSQKSITATRRADSRADRQVLPRPCRRTRLPYLRKGCLRSPDTACCAVRTHRPDCRRSTEQRGS